MRSSAQLIMSSAQDSSGSNVSTTISSSDTPNQNALLKQLLSSTPAQKTNNDTSPVKTGFSLEAQLDQPTDANESYKAMPKEVLSSMASQIPNPQASVGPTPITSQTKVSTAAGQTGTATVSAQLVQQQQQPQTQQQQQQQSLPQQQQQQQQQLGGNGAVSMSSAVVTTVSTPVTGGQVKSDSQASMSEGLASHMAAVAKLPTQPVPPTSLAGVVQVQPSTASTIITPQTSLSMRAPVPGGIQNLLQSLLLKLLLLLLCWSRSRDKLRTREILCWSDWSNWCLSWNLLHLRCSWN